MGRKTGFLIAALVMVPGCKTAKQDSGASVKDEPVGERGTETGSEPAKEMSFTQLFIPYE